MEEQAYLDQQIGPLKTKYDQKMVVNAVKLSLAVKPRNLKNALR